MDLNLIVLILNLICATMYTSMAIFLEENKTVNIICAVIWSGTASVNFFVYYL